MLHERELRNTAHMKVEVEYRRRIAEKRAMRQIRGHKHEYDDVVDLAAPTVGGLHRPNLSVLTLGSSIAFDTGGSR